MARDLSILRIFWILSNKILDVRLGDDKTLVVSRRTKSGGRVLKLAVLAGGCFWCVEANLKILPGVVSVRSGYSGGEGDMPTYENYMRGGHREVVEVTYDPNLLSYRQLLEFFLKGIDPTDAEGSFADRGKHYSPAIYYGTEEERKIAEEVLQELEESKRFAQPVAVEVLPRQSFWSAEDFHQDYAEKNPRQYARYKKGSGRDAFKRRYWGV